MKPDFVCSCEHCMGAAEPPAPEPCLKPSPNGILRCSDIDGHAGSCGGWGWTQ